jgi:hypothetical protein
MEACYGGTDVMERSCAVARGIDINIFMAVTTGLIVAAIFLVFHARTSHSRFPSGTEMVM